MISAHPIASRITVHNPRSSATWGWRTLAGKLSGLVSLIFLLAVMGLSAAASPPPAADSLAPEPREYLSLLGIDDAHLQKFSDGRPLDGAEHEPLAELLFAVRRIQPQFIERWAKESGDFGWDDLAKNSSQRRGQFFALGGHVTKVSEHRLPEEPARRLALRRFYRCECQVGEGGQPAVVYASEVPLAWPLDQAIREPVGFQGVYFKLSAGPTTSPDTPTFAVARLAWHPAGLLGRLGLDAGLLDGVRHYRDFSVSLSDQEAFYQLLAGAGRLPRGEIDTAAERALAQLNEPPEKPGEEPTFSIPKLFEHAGRVEALRRELRDLEQLGEHADRVLDLTRQKSAARTDAERATIEAELSEALAEFQAKAQAVRVPIDVVAVLAELDGWIRGRLADVRQKLAAAADSPYSQGRPMIFEGTARRAVRVLVDDAALRERLGLDHYYHVALFADLGRRSQLDDGSQISDTLVIAHVRELPPGMPEGEQINERVRVSGVFLKLYPHVPQKAEHLETDERHLAPLLIGQSTTWIARQQRSHYELALIVTSVFLLLLGGVALWSWRMRRADVRARARTTGRRGAGGPRGSLDDLKLD